MPSWCNDYVGIPFEDHGRSRSGCDCWGLVRMVYADRLGIGLPDFSEIYQSTMDGEAISKLCRREATRWNQVADAQPLDVILLRVKGIPWHVGLVIEPFKMLHSLRGCAAVVEDFTRPFWAPRIEGFFRYA